MTGPILAELGSERLSVGMLLVQGSGRRDPERWLTGD
jgi:hypothetical protein